MRTIRFCFGIVRYAKLNRRVVIVYDQELLPVIISHQTPTYLTGLIQEVSSILLGSFKFNVILKPIFLSHHS
jgi:hypothetical protein